MRYLFTFGFKNAAQVLSASVGEEEPFVSVYSANYSGAMKKVLKLKLPYVDSEEDLLFASCQEEPFVEDEEQTETEKK